MPVEISENGRMSEELLRLDGVSVRAPSGRWILRDVSFSVHRGEIVTIIGPNGGGKTTAVRAALGIITPDAGSVWRAPGLRVGYTPQRVRPDLTLPLTVRRFLRLGIAASEADIDAALERTGARRLAGQQLADLSSGELQRVLLARALLRKPHLLVLDEPVQGVDFAGEAAMYDLIRGVRDETGCGVLMVSHDLHFVMAGTDKVVCINVHVCCAGTPQAVSEHPHYTGLFGTAATRHQAAYAHMHDHEHGLNHDPGREDARPNEE